tara:strand:+ start:5671 stop:6216 length:546 start_codon:yes stop_codon:yes gene_type:complete
MKTILSVIAIVNMVVSLQANDVNIHHKYVKENTAIKKMNPVNISSIIDDVLSKKGSYNMTGSLTILDTSKSGNGVQALDLSFRNSPVIAYKGRDYIQANPQALRNDNNRKNEVRVYVHHDTKGNVNTKNVKLNWKSGSTGEIVGILNNVSVLYQKNSILITGSFEKNGYIVGVSLAISKVA